MVDTGDRFDWYQSESNVCINYLRKNLKQSDVRVDIQEQSVSLILITTSGDELLKTFRLSHPVVPEKSSYRVTAMKIEVQLRKATEVRWSYLESKNSVNNSETPKSQDVTKIVHSYPSSSKFSHDWNKIEKEASEIEDEEDPLNKMFKNIYANASDETRKAMIKSFTESAGTVLSTNWNEVGAGKVEMKPPDGMEFKKYEM
ncbi:unnamed protein product [Trichobilharzia szidati]|nr:unnamed protein product [Trichobilharzia szidati]